MDLPTRPKTLSGKQVSLFCSSLVGHANQAFRQALAAIGQGRLIALWDNLFGQLGTPIAQILLTRGDLSDVCFHGTTTLPSRVSHFLEALQVPQRCEHPFRAHNNGCRSYHQ